MRRVHTYYLALMVYHTTYSQPIFAAESDPLLHPGGDPPDGGVGSSLPVVIASLEQNRKEGENRKKKS